MVELTADELARAKTFSPLPAVPADPTNGFADNAAAAVLGQRLYFDSSYSGALAVASDGANGGLGAVGDRGKVACVSCHASPSGDDNRSKPGNVSLGTDFGTRNALPVVNAAFNKWTNWGGRFDSQWSLPLAVAENARIMKSTRLEVAHPSTAPTTTPSSPCRSTPRSARPPPTPRASPQRESRRPPRPTPMARGSR